MRIFVRVVRSVVVVLFISTVTQAAYKPVDMSDITGEQKVELAKLWAKLRRMSPAARDCYICEQLGLCFSRDYDQVLSSLDGYPATRGEDAYFVGSRGKVMRWTNASNAAHEKWSECYYATRKFKTEASLVPFKKEVQEVVRNTAKYLLKKMPKERRCMMLALMSKTVYDVQGTFDYEKVDNWGMENGIDVKAPKEEGRGYVFMDTEGKEHDIRALLEDGNKDWRWRQIIWRCENLVGARDILALFPEEVEAMRKYHKARAAQLKDAAKARNEALLVAVDEMMKSLPDRKRLCRIAEAVGLYYRDHRDSGYNPGGNCLNPDATIFLPSGSRCTGREMSDEKPELLQQIPHEAIVEHYRQSIEQMAKRFAEVRFKEMHPLLRDMLRAQLSRKLIMSDGSPAETEKSICVVQTFDRSWRVPVDVPVDIEHTYFRSSAGLIFPFSLYKMYGHNYSHTISIVHLCARIFGRAKAVKLVPLGSDAALTAEQRRAWLAEKMGFCFTEDGTPAYQSERTANENAVYVDAQGKVRGLNDKNSLGWRYATNIAHAVGYDKFTAPYKDEIKDLAVQTSKHILVSMPPGLRQSWLAECNKLFFTSNSGDPYVWQNGDTESGIKFSHHGTWIYSKCLYYDPSGKIVQTTHFDDVWARRWRLLLYCESVVGIEAINESFHDEVEAMRSAYKKSPFYRQ